MMKILLRNGCQGSQALVPPDTCSILGLEVLLLVMGSLLRYSIERVRKANVGFDATFCSLGSYSQSDVQGMFDVELCQ
jgi:hypothetical protein